MHKKTDIQSNIIKFEGMKYSLKMYQNIIGTKILENTKYEYF